MLQLPDPPHRASPDIRLKSRSSRSYLPLQPRLHTQRRIRSCRRTLPILCEKHAEAKPLPDDDQSDGIARESATLMYTHRRQDNCPNRVLAGLRYCYEILQWNDVPPLRNRRKHTPLGLPSAFPVRRPMSRKSRTVLVGHVKLQCLAELRHAKLRKLTSCTTEPKRQIDRLPQAYRLLGRRQRKANAVLHGSHHYARVRYRIVRASDRG